jgi:hypothetical protein
MGFQGVGPNARSVPRYDAAGKGAGLGFRTRQSAIELDGTGPLIKEVLQVLCRPAVFGRPKQHHDLGLVLRERIQHRGRRCRSRLQCKVVAVECEFYAGSAGAVQGIGCVHIRASHWSAAGGGGAAIPPGSTAQPCNRSLPINCSGLGRTSRLAGSASPKTILAGRPFRSSRFLSHQVHRPPGARLPTYQDSRLA